MENLLPSSTSPSSSESDRKNRSNVVYNTYCASAADLSGSNQVRRRRSSSSTRKGKTARSSTKNNTTSVPVSCLIQPVSRKKTQSHKINHKMKSKVTATTASSSCVSRSLHTDRSVKVYEKSSSYRQKRKK